MTLRNNPFLRDLMKVNSQQPVKHKARTVANQDGKFLHGGTSQEGCGHCCSTGIVTMYNLKINFTNKIMGESVPRPF